MLIDTLKTREEALHIINNYKAVIFKFTATWCGPCKRVSGLVDELYEQVKDHVVMVIVDIDKAKDIASYMKIRSVPTMISYIDKQPMDSVLGADRDGIIAFFNKTYQKSSEV
jgi:thioredoxin 1